MTVEDSLKKILEDERVISESRCTIGEKRDKLEQSLKPLIDKIQVADNEKNQLLRSTHVRVSFDDLVSALATKWDCKKEQIRYEITVDEVGNGQEMTREEILESIKECGFRRVRFYFISPDRKHLADFSRPLTTFKSLQKDGRPFSDTLSFKKQELKFGFVRYVVSFDEWNYMFDFRLEELLLSTDDSKLKFGNKFDEFYLKTALEIEKRNEVEKEEKE